MAKNVNDPVDGLLNAGREALKAANAAESQAAILAHHVAVLLGDADRFGEVVPMLQWANSPEATKAVADQVIAKAECAAEDITLAVSKERNQQKKEAIRLERRALAELFKTAVRLLGAMAILADRYAVDAEYKPGIGWHVPVQWFLPEGMEAAGRTDHPRVTFVRTKGSVAVMARKAEHDGEDDSADSVEVLLIKPSMSGVIEAAYGKRKTAPNAGQGSTSGTSSGSAGEGTSGAAGQDGTSSAKPGAAPDFTEARRVLAKEASTDDYKHRPTGKVAEDWQLFFDDMATNNYFRAMMQRAVQRAQKADGDIAAAAAAKMAADMREGSKVA